VSAVDGFEQWKPSIEVPDFGAIQAKHWKRRPSFEDDDAVNVKSFGAKGDGVTDDTGAFEGAIAAHSKIFVPPGNYKLTGDLSLAKDAQLFSVSEFLTSIGARRGRSGDGSAATGSEPFTLSTRDDPSASPGLWFVSVGGQVNWRSGQGIAMHARSSYRFSGNAGGKLYAIVAMGQQFVIEDSRNPLSFYSLNVERVTQNPQSIIRNSKHLRVYYFKVEAGTRNSGETGGGDENTPARIEGSDDVRIYCMYGNVRGLSSDRAMLEIVDSTHVMASQVKAFFPDLFPHIREVIGEEERSVPSSKICALYVRD
jgi:hypothetical protein